MPVQTRWIDVDTPEVDIWALVTSAPNGLAHNIACTKCSTKTGVAMNAYISVYKSNVIPFDVSKSTLIVSAIATVILDHDSTGVLLSATGNIPQTPLNPDDYIAVLWTIAMGGGVGEYNQIWSRTERLGATQLDAATWTLYYYLDRATSRDTTCVPFGGYSSAGDLYWNASYCPTRIEGFSYSMAYTPVMRFHQKGTTTIYTSG